MKGAKRIFNWRKLIFPLLLLILVFIAHSIVPQFLFDDLATKITLSLVYLAGGYLLSRLINVSIDHHIAKHDMNTRNNLEARKVQTRMKYVRILSTIIIFLVSVALALRQFDTMRELSTSILASAGIAGIVLAFSAQKLLANIIAGFEIAFTQPIRIDDVVVVEGEWGRVEEINATHVVVKIWDQRRLVLPIEYFVNHPFQNWTKTSADIWGTVELFVDYRMPVQEVRKELTKILKKSKHWDGKVNALQVTDANDKTIKLRALMSAKDSGEAWELRCEVREKMIDFLQKKYPQHLPKIRSENIEGAVADQISE